MVLRSAAFNREGAPLRIFRKRGLIRWKLHAIFPKSPMALLKAPALLRHFYLLRTFCKGKKINQQGK